MEFDHLFICVADLGAKEGELLRDFGLTEGAPNHHAGQGTANRRFFFENSFIELLYVTDQLEILSDLTKPTKLHERFPSKCQTASPFGICFRPSGGKVHAPFKNWSYKPKYLPQELEIAVGDSPSSEPMWFYLSFGSRPDIASPDRRQPAIHDCGFKEITSVKITAPIKNKISDPAAAANNVSDVAFSNASEHLLQIGFDFEVSKNKIDFRPALPLILKW